MFVLKIYNTKTRKKEEFVPIEAGKIKIYACGPTVYNYIHIGNARPICIFDALRRFLSYKGYNVTFAQNFTDIDDKIIARAIEQNCDYLQVADQFIKEYITDSTGLNVLPADICPRATQNISEIISMVENLIYKGFAYPSNSGDVYFRTAHFTHYGALSGQPLDELAPGARISVGENKENPLDFALWKVAKLGEPFFESPWGKGRPGWHIECSAMARRYLGNTIDIHCGGQDLIFPHHENEIAQSECCNGVTFANFWMHNGYINVDNHKMSKSLGNFFTVRDVSQKYGYEPIRYLMLASHYRSPINYSPEIIEQCVAALSRLHKFRDNLDFLLANSREHNGIHEPEPLPPLHRYRDDFVSALDDDFNTAGAIGVLFELVREVNTAFIGQYVPSRRSVIAVVNLFDELVDILGILYNNKKKKNTTDSDIEELIARRQKARENRDFAAADAIRDELRQRNIVLEDTPSGVKWSELP